MSNRAKIGSGLGQFHTFTSGVLRVTQVTLACALVVCVLPREANAADKKASKKPAQPKAEVTATAGETPATDAAPAVESPGADAKTVPDSDTAEARKRFDRGVQLYADGDFALALIEFQRAHELVSNYRVLYNIGQVSVQLRQYARARIALEAYMQQGGDTVEPERAAEVNADIEMLKTRTAFININTKRPGAQVLLDGLPVGVTPLEAPVLVDAGEHKVELRQSGFKSAERFVTLAGGDEQLIAVELAEMTEPTRTVEKQTIVVQKPGGGDGTWTWVGFGSTAVLAVGAVATGVLGLSAAADLEDLRNTVDVSREELDGSESRARRMFLASDILGASAIVVGGTTLYFVLSADDEETPPVKVGISPKGIAVSGAF